MKRMKRLAGLTALALAFGGGGGGQAVAQDPSPFPAIIVDCWDVPYGGHVVCRVHTEGFTDIVSGSVDIRWEFACEDGRCPPNLGQFLRRGRTTIPCGSAESGPVNYEIRHLPARPAMSMGNTQTTVTLKITAITFTKWDDDFVDDVNRRYGYDSRSYNRDGTYETVRVDPCGKGEYTGSPEASVGSLDTTPVMN